MSLLVEKKKLFFYVNFLIAPLILLLLAFCFNQFIIRGWYLEDDAYFYAQIAYNLGVNKISSFDTINIASGYHLLWTWILSGISWIVSFFSLNKIIHLYCFIATYFLLAFNAAAILSKNLREWILLACTLSITILMESAILAFCLALFFKDIIWDEKITYKGYIALLFVPLCRADSTLIPGIFSFYFLYKGDFKTFFKLNGVLIAGILLQIFSMKILFGHFFSSASLIKIQNFGNITLFIERLKGYTQHTTIISLVLFSWGMFINILEKNIKNIIILIASITFIAFHLVANGGIRIWYYLSPLFLISVVILNSPQFKKITYGIIALVVVYYIRAYIITHLNPQNKIEFLWEKSFPQEIQKHVPVDEPIYQIDGSGWVGYFSNRKIINGDGLVNSYDYLKKLKSNALQNYLTENKIHYVITNTPLTRPYIIDWHGLKVTEDNVTLLIDVPSNIKGYYMHYRLYKLK